MATAHKKDKDMAYNGHFKNRVGSCTGVQREESNLHR